MANFGNELVLVPAGTVITATGSGATVRLDNRSSIRIQSVVAAVAGTSPTLAVKVQTSHDGTNWNDVGSALTNQTAAGDSGWHSMGTIDRYVRAAWTVGGTGGPNFTFGVNAEAV